jgi:hypothetical protein
MKEANASPKDVALRLALEYVELVPDDRYNADHIDRDALITAIKAALEAKVEPPSFPTMLRKMWSGGEVQDWINKNWVAQPKQEAKDEPKCNPHPKAPHGFNRNASHSADRYVCECEGWDAYDAGYQAGIEDTYKRMDEPQQEAKDEPVAWRTYTGRGYYIIDKTLEEAERNWPDKPHTPLYTTPPQRKPLTDEEIDAIVVDEVGLDADADEMHNFARAIEAAHGIKGEA